MNRKQIIMKKIIIREYLVVSIKSQMIISRKKHMLPVAPILVRQNLSPQQQIAQKKLEVLSIRFSHQWEQ